MRAESSGYQVSSPWMSPMPVLSPQAPQVHRHRLGVRWRKTLETPFFGAGTPKFDGSSFTIICPIQIAFFVWNFITYTGQLWRILIF
jgi:hypothetical protein